MDQRGRETMTSSYKVCSRHVPKSRLDVQQPLPQCVSMMTCRIRGTRAANRSKRIVDVKNKDAETILEQALWLRGSAGRKTAHRVKNRHITQQPSVQVCRRTGALITEQFGLRGKMAHRVKTRTSSSSPLRSLCARSN